jgi:hypothetical protein
LETSIGKDIFTIGTIYRPPSSGADYYESILDELEIIHSRYDNVILLGDLNHNYTFDTSLHTNPINCIENVYNMKQLITEPTRITPQSSSLIDVILTTIPNSHVKSGVINIALSDHKLVYTVIDVNTKIKQIHNYVRFRSYKTFDRTSFLNELDSKLQNDMDVPENITEQNLDSLWNEFKNIFLSVSNKHAPLKTQRLKNRINPWFNKSIINLIYERDHIKSKADKTRSPILYKQYKQLRNKVTKVIRKEKAAYFSSEFNQNTFDSKGKSNVIKQILHKNQIKPIPSQLNAEMCNKYFSEIGLKTTSKLKKHGDFKSNLTKCLYTFHFKHVSCHSVEQQLLSFGDSISKQDVLDMDSKLLCISSKIIAPIVTYFINCSFDLGIVLSDWKLSRVTPIYKGKGDACDQNNYRPISVIGHIAKIIEKLVQKQLIKYLTDHDLISLSQSAYLKRHSTITSLHNVIEDWYDNISDKIFTGICLLDISKCFDSIDHKILLTKLKAYGIDNIQHKWFSSYLHNRSQKVVCQNKISPESRINIGVPQGSVLGPILFLLFSNDLPNNTFLGSCNMFADDTLIYITGNSPQETESNLQMCIDKAVKWYEDNNLLLNASKSNTLLLKPRKHNSQYELNIAIGNQIIKHVSEAEYLGLRVDDSLSWTSQISKVCKCLGAKISNLKQLRKIGNDDILLYFYETHIQPIIDYGITLWSRTSTKSLSKIQKMQNVCSRIITNNYDYKIRGIDIVKSLKWMNVSERARYFTCVLIFKCLHNLTPFYLQNDLCFKKDMSDRHSKRFKHDVFIPPFVSTFKDKSFFIQGSKEWNNLPHDLKSIQSLQQFKNSYKRAFGFK